MFRWHMICSTYGGMQQSTSRTIPLTKVEKQSNRTVALPVRWHPLPTSKEGTYLVGSIKAPVKPFLLSYQKVFQRGEKEWLFFRELTMQQHWFVCLWWDCIKTTPTHGNKTSAPKINKTCWQERGKYPHEPLTVLSTLLQGLLRCIAVRTYGCSIVTSSAKNLLIFSRQCMAILKYTNDNTKLVNIYVIRIWMLKGITHLYFNQANQNSQW